MGSSEHSDETRGGHGQPSTSYTGRRNDDDLAATLSDVALTLQDENTLEQTLDAIVTVAAQTVPGAEHAGLTVVRRRREVHTPAATADVVRQVDRAQYETNQGPCLDSVHERHTVRLADMATEGRWPDFCRRALALGVRSMLSIQMYVRHDDLGALNFYSMRTDGFTDESEDVGLLLASHAAIAMAGAQREHDLSAALSTRDLIGQAKGILMERHKVTGDQAFHLLVRVSQHANVKLTDICRALIDTGELAHQRTR
ncbi:GAF and ANTAR domain-containing protein [Actinoplanes sp. RD1]|uniref:GAF and ANTAR domain-containing protein n=1 Tax=Actinoplanes sp. RD1 TaxID=3064538 RepID=UPI002741E044|nr:GAF and ANTAR domain-containing protein [Actinoplanes sp. RD1]